MVRIRGMIGEAMSLLGFDGTTYRRVRVDPAGHVQLAPGGVNLQQYAAPYYWDGSLIGHGGNLILRSPVLSPTEILVIRHVWVVVPSGSVEQLHTRVMSGGRIFYVDYVVSPALNVQRQSHCPLVLAGDARLEYVAVSVGPNTEIYTTAIGYFVRR